jgi:hypothetical protein
VFQKAVSTQDVTNHPVWTGAENLAPTGIRSPDRPARSESLYRLSYRGPHITAERHVNRPRVIAIVQDYCTALVLRNYLENPEIEFGAVDLICWCDVTTAYRGVELVERVGDGTWRTHLNK